MILKNQGRVWKVGLLSLALLISITIVPIQEASAGFPIGIDPDTEKKFTKIKYLPLNLVVVEGTRLWTDINWPLLPNNGILGWLRGWWDIISVVAEKNDIWMQAGIQFELRRVFRVSDPNPPPPAGTGPGHLGDILDCPAGGHSLEHLLLLRSVEIRLLLAGCYRGITEIKIHHFCDAAGANALTCGEATDIPDPCEWTILKETSVEPATMDWCGPNNFVGVNSGVSLWRPGVVEAHEVGHLFGLTHRIAPAQLMHPWCNQWTDASLTAADIATARDYADHHVPSREVRDKHNGTIIPEPLLALSRSVDEVFEVSSGFIDLFDVDTLINLDTSVANFTAFTTGVMPSDIEDVSYSFLMNLDNNDLTGVNLELNGVDAIAEILVDKIAGTPHVSYNLTLFDLAKNPVPVVDPAVIAREDTLRTEDLDPWAEAIGISIPESILSTFVPIVEGYPMIAKSSWSIETDQAPVSSVSHAIPQRAFLTADSYDGIPGSVVSTSGTYFTPNAPLWIMFDNIKLVETSTDSLGQFTESVTIPTNATVGDHSLWAFSPIEEANGDVVVFQVPPPPPPPPPPCVGGSMVLVGRLTPDLSPPYIGLASTIIIATVTTTIYVKHIKRRKSEQ